MLKSLAEKEAQFKGILTSAFLDNALDPWQP